MTQRIFVPSCKCAACRYHDFAGPVDYVRKLQRGPHEDQRLQALCRAPDGAEFVAYMSELQPMPKAAA
jgi:hypothetical protein